jgi:hypothetical protein
MIAMLKMQVSHYGLKVNVTKYFSIKPLNNPHIRGVFCLCDDGCIWELVCNKIIDCKGSFYYVSSTPFILMRLTVIIVVLIYNLLNFLCLFLSNKGK